MQLTKQDALETISKLPDDAGMDEIKDDNVLVPAVIHKRQEFQAEMIEQPDS